MCSLNHCQRAKHRPTKSVWKTIARTADRTRHVAGETCRGGESPPQLYWCVGTGRPVRFTVRYRENRSRLENQTGCTAGEHPVEVRLQVSITLPGPSTVCWALFLCPGRAAREAHRQEEVTAGRRLCIIGPQGRTDHIWECGISRRATLPLALAAA